MNWKSYALGAALLVGFTAIQGVGHAAIQNPDPHDIDYEAEHMAEAAMNNRFLSLPYAAPQVSKGDWVFTVQPGYSATKVDFISLKGPMLAASVGYSFRKNWTLRGIGFYDKFRFSGGSGHNLLNPLFSENIPLDLPENAEFSNPRGDYVHWGVGPALDWEFSSSPTKGRSWVLTGGALWDRVDLKNYRFDYVMTSGASAGQSGVLDHSARYDYVTPFFSLQYNRNVGPHFSISPRFIAGIPLPRQGWIGRISGPGFDVSGDTKVIGNGSHMGDPFSGIGLAIQHKPTGLSLDIGTSIYQTLFEGKVHKGIDKNIVINVAWSFRSEKVDKNQ